MLLIFWGYFFFHLMEVSRLQCCLVSNVLQNIFCVMQKNEMRVSKLWHFWVEHHINIPYSVPIHFHFVPLLNGAQASAYSVCQTRDTLPTCWHALLRGVCWYVPPGKGGRQIYLSRGVRALGSATFAPGLIPDLKWRQDMALR